MVPSYVCLQPKWSQCYKQTYKVLKSKERVCSALSLQGEEAVSNAIKVALILEDGSLCWWAVYLSLASEFSFWQGHWQKQSQENISTKKKHKLIKTGWKLEEMVSCGSSDKEYFKKCLIALSQKKKIQEYNLITKREKNRIWLDNPLIICFVCNF